MAAKKRILIIDDEQDFCFFVKRNLEASGDFEVLTSNDGKVGMEMIVTRKPDLVLLDVVMPDVTGPDIAEFLLNTPEDQRVPFIFLTAIVTKDEIGTEPLREIKGNMFLQKPVDTKTLIYSIKSMFDKVKTNKRINDILSRTSE